MSDSRTLLIMRHAKSSWANGGLTDHQRPLNKRGLRDAEQMGGFLLDNSIQIDQVIASTAVRAKTTAKILTTSLGRDPVEVLTLNDEFYLAPPRVYLNYLRSNTHPEVRTVILIGHNPGLESLVQHLSGRHESMPTAAIACFEVTTPWSEFDQASCRFIDVWRPKEVLDFYR